MVFFVLSGFFIHLRAARATADGEPVKLDLGSYVRRRVHRLVPPYVLALFVTLCLDALGRHFWPGLYHAQVGDILLKNSFSKMGYESAAVVPAAVFLPSMLGQHFGTNGPLWSLAYEVVYYAAYPFWFKLYRLNSGAAFLMIPMALFCGTMALSGWFALVVSHYAIWLTGAALAEGVLRLRNTSWHGRVCCGSVFAVGVVLHHSTTTLGLAWTVIAAMLFGGGLVGLFAMFSASFSTRLPMRTLEYFGIRSYTLYIVHFPVLALLSAWVFAVVEERTATGWLALAGFLLALGAGLGAFSLCERYFLHARIRISSPEHS